MTRSSNLKLLIEPYCKSKIERNSIRFRGAKLFNKLRLLGIISSDVENADKKTITKICHDLKECYLVNNTDLTEFVFYQ